MKVVYSTESKQDLRRIGLHIARDAPLRALSFIRELRVKIGQIADTPFGFPLVPNYEASGIRRRPIGNYLVFYMVRDDGVYIVRVVHAAMDYEKLLFPGEGDAGD